MPTSSDTKWQRGMIESGITVAVVAIVLVSLVIYVKGHRDQQAKVTQTTHATTTTKTTAPTGSINDPDLNQAGMDAGTSVTNLNSSYSSDTSSSNLSVTEPSIQ